MTLTSAATERIPQESRDQQQNENRANKLPKKHIKSLFARPLSQIVGNYKCTGVTQAVPTLLASCQAAVPVAVAMVIAGSAKSHVCNLLVYIMAASSASAFHGSAVLWTVICV